jgi:hypothetical protein
MIIAVLRYVIFGFIGLSVLYLLVSVYSRSVRREKLEKHFDAGGVDGTRDDYIAQGMARYEKGLRKKLIWLVYVIPTAVVIGLIWILNFM